MLNDPAALSWAGAWGMNVVSSVGIILVNKALMTSYGFAFATSLTALHFITTAAVGNAATAAGALAPSKHVPARTLMWFAFVASLAVVSMNVSLMVNSVGFYQITKLSIIPACCLFEALLHRKTFSPAVKAAVVGVMVGVGICTVTDVTVNTAGLLAAIVAVLSTTFQQIFIGSLQKQYSVGSFDLLSKTAPYQAVLLVISGPTVDYLLTRRSLLAFRPTPVSVAFILLSCVLALFVNLSMYLCIGKFSAVSFQVLGHMKTLFVLVLGSALFHSPLTAKNLMGMAVAVLGMLAYSWAVEREKAAAAAAAAVLPVTKQQQKAEEQALLGVAVEGKRQDLHPSFPHLLSPFSPSPPPPPPPLPLFPPPNPPSLFLGPHLPFGISSPASSFSSPIFQCSSCCIRSFHILPLSHLSSPLTLTPLSLPPPPLLLLVLFSPLLVRPFPLGPSLCPHSTPALPAGRMLLELDPFLNQLTRLCRCATTVLPLAVLGALRSTLGPAICSFPPFVLLPAPDLSPPLRPMLLEPDPFLNELIKLSACARNSIAHSLAIGPNHFSSALPTHRTASAGAGGDGLKRCVWGCSLTANLRKKPKGGEKAGGDDVEEDESSAAEYRCVVRATDGKRKISTLLGPREHAKFQAAYALVLKAHMDSLKRKEKRERKKMKPSAPAS
ncbi:unnamed protein product [Closterium sp. NIES-65]|nr:unnamed protein product [Closterium sp. NIES-65]